MFKFTKTILFTLTTLATGASSAAKLEQVPLTPQDFVTPPASSMPGILWFWHSTPMTPEVIEEQMDEMHAAGFSGIMMFPLASTPKYYTEEFFELFEHVLRHAEKLDMSIWLTNDQAIPTGHGAMKVVPGGKIHEGLTLEPRPDLRAEKLLHVNQPITGGRTVHLVQSFPGYHDLPTTISFHNGQMHARATEAIIGNGGWNWKDYKYQLDVVPIPWSGNPLVPGNYTDTAWMFRTNKATQSGYAWALSDRTGLGQGVPALKRMILKDGKVSKQLPPVKLPFDAFEKRAYQIEVVMLNSRIETFVDGVSVDVTEDSTYTEGTVGIYLPHPCRGRYANIRVRSMADDLLFEDLCQNNSQWRFWGPSASIDEVFSVAALPVIDGKPQAEGIVDVSAQFHSDKPYWHAPAGEWQLDYFMKRKDFKQPYNYPDLYHPDTIKRHLQITYGEIVRRYPWAIGTTFKGFWSDEPHTTASKGKGWSAQFEKKLAEGGHDVGTTLAAVFNDLGREGRRLQAPYFQQTIEAWADPFARLQGEWCKSHGLDFMTNPVIDSSPPYGALSGGNGLQMNQWSNVPGVDAIYGQIMPGKRSLISRWATSSAHQMGNQHVLYEVFGGYGWDVTPDIVRYVNGNLMVRGANRASYHAYWSNPDAVGYAPPFDPSCTWWSVQDELNLWNGRLQEMSLGKALSNVGLMNPTSVLYADVMNLDGRLMNPAFKEVYYLLEDNQVCFDLVDETSLNDNPVMQVKAKPVRAGLQLGEQMYQLILLPRVSTLSLEALQTLEQMVEQGGVVIATHIMPKEELEGRDAELQALLTKLFGASPAAQPHRVGKGWTAFVKDPKALPSLFPRVTGLTGRSQVQAVKFEQAYPNIRVIKRERANAIVYLIMNEGDSTVEPTVTFYDDPVPQIWDPETGHQSVAPVYSSHGKWGVHVPIQLHPNQTKVVVFEKGGVAPGQAPHLLPVPESIDVLSVEATSDDHIVAELLVDSVVDMTLQGSFQDERFSALLQLPELPAIKQLTSGWVMHFEDAPETQHSVELGTWTRLRPNFSGTASYARSFTLPADALNAQRAWQIDLGTVKDVAQIEINGQRLEPLMWAPYVQDLTPYLQAGENHLKVEISNTLANKHGQVLDSGLLGPVRLLPKHRVEVKLSRASDAGYLPVQLPTAADQAGEALVSEFAYREVGDATLKMKLWYPADWKPGAEKLPASVFIFGGGWYAGATSQFDGIAPHLASRGMIVLAPEYRTHTDGVRNPAVCLQDAKSAMRYINAHADELGIDATRLAAGGRSAGGHLAAATAFCDGFNATGDDLSVSAKPTALILFNPVIDNGPGGFRHHDVKDYWEDFSPLDNISKNPPATIFLTGDHDQYTPLGTALRYQKTQQAQGGRCDLVVFKGGVHGSPFGAQFFPRTLESMDAFLVSIGYLTPKYRNLALNVGREWPKTSSNDVYHDMPIFDHSNVINGLTANKGHGGGYPSWGPDMGDNPWLKIDFGHEVEVDKVVITIRADFPHDSFWKSGTIEFSDGSRQPFTLQKLVEGQTITFPKKRTSWIRFTELKRAEDIWCAFTEVEVWGHDSVQ